MGRITSGNLAIVLEDKSQWNNPKRLEDLIYRLTWSPENISKTDMYSIASFLSDYEYCIFEMTNKRRNFVYKEIRKTLEES